MIKVINPATQQPIGEVKSDTDATVVQKNLYAHMAYRNWSKESVLDRVGVFLKVAELLDLHKNDLARQLCLETGLPLIQAKDEIHYSTQWIKKFINEAHKNTDSKTGQLGSPIGVVGLIMPWYHPYLLAFQLTVPALLAGNTVLYHGSPQASLSTLTLAGLFKEAGLPNGVFAPVIGEKPVTKKMLGEKLNLLIIGDLDQWMWLKSNLTWNTDHWYILSRDNRPIVTNPIFEDQNWAIEILKQSFFWAGQSPWSLKQIHISQEKIDQGWAALCEALESFHCGNPLDKQNKVGPIRQPQILESLLAEIYKTGASSLLHPELAPTYHQNYLDPFLLRSSELVNLRQAPCLTVSSYTSDITKDFVDLKDLPEKPLKSFVGLTSVKSNTEVLIPWEIFIKS